MGSGSLSKGESRKECVEVGVYHSLKIYGPEISSEKGHCYIETKSKKKKKTYMICGNKTSMRLDHNNDMNYAQQNNWQIHRAWNKDQVYVRYMNKGTYNINK